jgi:hypothetical protein
VTCNIPKSKLANGDRPPDFMPMRSGGTYSKFQIEGTAMRRLITSIPLLLLLVAALLTPGASATGAPPTPVSTTETFGAGDACEFPIEVVSEGKSGFNEQPNNPQFSAIQNSPTLRITVTGAGKSITVNATGAFHYIALPDGNFRIKAGGHNFLYGEPGVGATALATTGPIDVLVVDGHIAAMDLSKARVRDLCQELAP